MSKLLGTVYKVFQCDDRIPRTRNNIIDTWNRFTDVLWPRSRGLNSGYLREQVKFAPIFAPIIVTGTSPHWISGDSAWQIKYVLTLNALKFNDFYITNKTAGTITYDEGKLTDEDGNDISGLTSGDLVEEGIITMTEGLSAKWTAEIKDCFFP
jgi:hypothetical protein